MQWLKLLPSSGILWCSLARARARALVCVCFAARQRERLYAPKQNSSLEVCYHTWEPEVAHSVYVVTRLLAGRQVDAFSDWRNWFQFQAGTEVFLLTLLVLPLEPVHLSVHLVPSAASRRVKQKCREAGYRPPSYEYKTSIILAVTIGYSNIYLHVLFLCT